jgi:hypothetical protein
MLDQSPVLAWEPLIGQSDSKYSLAFSFYASSLEPRQALPAFTGFVLSSLSQSGHITNILLRLVQRRGYSLCVASQQ